ncbi:Dabb family protein [Pseudomonas sp. GM30]|uniref:Dabb family protein n=1 Tax=Pseudomonas sp. GM30 TaxID=1144328 RepID=UPI00027056E1|nr:Dabb family protein [Pseudomonas sp. GM30]EUB84699.1 Stress responsive alpha-beta barrel domain-containing protein [Pseudomonas sp. GM30]
MSDNVKHIVMWNLKGRNDAERHQAARQIKASFDSLLGRIPGMTHLEIGVDFSRIEYACDVVLYSEFVSREALENYAVHPEHLRVKQELGDLRIARYQVDYCSTAQPPGL